MGAQLTSVDTHCAPYRIYVSLPQHTTGLCYRILCIFATEHEGSHLRHHCCTDYVVSVVSLSYYRHHYHIDDVASLSDGAVHYIITT